MPGGPHTGASRPTRCGWGGNASSACNAVFVAVRITDHATNRNRTLSLAASDLTRRIPERRNCTSCVQTELFVIFVVVLRSLTICQLLELKSFSKLF